MVAIAVNPGFKDFDEGLLRRTCKKVDVELFIVPTNIYKVVFEERKEKNPCSLCANLRRGTLNTTAQKLGCNKIALGRNFFNEPYFLRKSFNIFTSFIHG